VGFQGEGGRRRTSGQVQVQDGRTGLLQVPGVDFEETYAPVGRLTSLRVLLALSATHDLWIRQADVEGAYLNGKLDVDMYMKYPEEMTPKRGCDTLRLLGTSRFLSRPMLRFKAAAISANLSAISGPDTTEGRSISRAIHSSDHFVTIVK